MTTTDPTPTFDATTLAHTLGGRLAGENRLVTTLVAPAQLASAGSAGGVVVLESAAQLEQARQQPGIRTLGAAVVPDGLEAAPSCPVIFVAEPRLAFAQLSALFAPTLPEPYLSERAFIHESAVLGEGVGVGAGAVLGAGVSVGAGCRVGAGCVLGEGVVLGKNTLLHANVTLYPGVRLGARVILHSGVVVGADGFGYAFGAQGALKIHHLGTVVLEDDVEIGANSCVDRGTLGETRVGARSKIDNLCQIGHNVQVGPDCIIAGGAAIGGSTVLERGVMLGGAVAVKDHLRLGAGVRIAGRSSVTKSVPAGQTWAGYPAQPQRKWVRELYLLGKLETLWQAFKGATKGNKDPVA